jgi:hypothetical protein
LFYDFLQNSQETAKALLLFELPIAGRPLKRTFVLQCGLWPSGSGGSAAIPAGDRRISARGGWGSVLWATRVRFGAWLVKKGRPVGVLSGSRRWPPLEQLLRRDGRPGGFVNGRRAMVGVGDVLGRRVLGRWEHRERPGTS